MTQIDGITTNTALFGIVGDTDVPYKLKHPSFTLKVNKKNWTTVFANILQQSEIEQDWRMSFDMEVDTRNSTVQKVDYSPVPN